MSKEVILKDKKVVVIREPKVRDIAALDDVTGEVTKEVHLIANLGELDVEYVMNLDLKDYEKLQEPIQGFLL